MFKKLDNIGSTLLLLFAMMVVFGLSMVLAARTTGNVAEPVENATSVAIQTTETTDASAAGNATNEPTTTEFESADAFLWIYGPVINFFMHAFS